MGKKYLVEKIIYLYMYFIKKKLSGSGIFFFFESLEKVKPTIGLKFYVLKKKKVQRMTAIPYIATVVLQYKKAIFWLMNAIQIRKEKKWCFKVFQEFYDILLNKSGASLLKKKEFYKYVILFKTTKKFKW